MPTKTDRSLSDNCFDIGYDLAIKNISTHTLQSLLPIVWEEGLAYSFTNTL